MSAPRRESDLPMAVLATLLLAGLPLLGAWCAGLPLARYGEFPPLSRYIVPAAFSWTVFAALVLIEIAFYAPVVALLTRLRRDAVPRPASSKFPFWGWIAVAWTLVWWAIAWVPMAWSATAREFSFSPLWFGYIVAVNALTKMRTGRCMLTAQPRRMSALFLASAVFWWFFEYLNRYVQNWYYVGLSDFTPLRYFLFATLPFSTVLPAVMGTAEFIESFVPNGALAACRIRLPRMNRAVAATMLALAAFGLAGIGVWPDALFPLLWLSPLLILVALSALRGRSTIFDAPASGDWRRLAALSLAALICGFFWEMWNGHSLAKWIYQVPFVQRFHVFEMPLLGFAGYLPFGWECAVIADVLCRRGDSGCGKR